MAPLPRPRLLRAQLLSEVWGYDSCYGGTRTVDVRASSAYQARYRIRTDEISTVRNVGYSFNSTRAKFWDFQPLF